MKGPLLGKTWEGADKPVLWFPCWSAHFTPTARDLARVNEASCCSIHGVPLSCCSKEAPSCYTGSPRPAYFLWRNNGLIWLLCDRNQALVSGCVFVAVLSFASARVLHYCTSYGRNPFNGMQVLLKFCLHALARCECSQRKHQVVSCR